MSGADVPPNAFTELVGCQVPVQLATMGGGPGSPRLAAAVSAAGGLGMLSAAYPQAVPEQVAEARGLTEAPLGIGFFAFDLPARRAEVEAVASQVRVVEFFWGDPQPDLVAVVHAGGALACWQVGSVDDAAAAADAGCDLVVAQGVEAGGHVRGTTPLLELVPAVADRVGVPVIAAGGISTGDHAAAAVRAGASAVRVGTRFLATEESAAHADYVEALLRSDGDDTELTTAFDLGWPDAPHRVLRESLEAAREGEGVVGHSRLGGLEWDVDRWSTQPPSTFCTGNVRAMPMYAGKGVGDVRTVTPAAAVVAELAAAIAAAG